MTIWACLVRVGLEVKTHSNVVVQILQNLCLELLLIRL